MPLTEEQRSIITATVPLVKERGLEVTKLFYKNLLTEHPELRNLFSHSAQASSHQAAALATSLYAYASHINDLAPILPVVEKITQKHASLNIQPEQYAIVGEGVLRAMRETLGADVFTDEVKAAWLEAYNELAAIMIGREEDIYREHEQTTGGWRAWRKMKLLRKVNESSEVTSFYWTPHDSKDLPTFKPGQYVSVKVRVPSLDFEQIRQYSLSDAPPSPRLQANGHVKPALEIDGEYKKVNGSEPQQKTYRITVKREAGINLEDSKAQQYPGYVSNVLHDVYNEGDILEMAHPAGEFFLDFKSANVTSPIVLISAGVGLTPMMSILRTLIKEHSEKPVSWIHAARNTSTDPFTTDISELTKKHANLKSKIYHTNPADGEKEGEDYNVKGRLNVLAMSETEKKELLFSNDDATEYYICGPEQFMVDVGKGLQGCGVGAERVKMELFGVGSIQEA